MSFDPAGMSLSLDLPLRPTRPSEASAWWRRHLASTPRGLVQHGGAILGLCAIILLWSGIFHFSAAEREGALEGAARDTANMARAFEEHIVRSIKAIDQSLLYFRNAYEKDPAGFDVPAWTRETQALTDLTFQIALIDRSGMMRSSGLAPVGSGIDLSDREHFRVHADSAADSLFISRPMLARFSNKWLIHMTRKLIAPDGRFDGVIVMSLDPHYLSRFYESMDLGRHGQVTLVGLDGLIRATNVRGPGQDPIPAVGRSLLKSPLFTNYARAQSGTYAAASVIDGVHRIFSYRGVRDFPLIVMVGIAEREVLARYEANRVTYLLVATALSALLLAVTLQVVLHQARLMKAREQLRRSEAGHAQKSRLLEMTLDHMSHGLLMVDADGFVQICNRHLVAALNLPKAMMARQPHFSELLDWQWRQGEFGPPGGAVDEGILALMRTGGLSDPPNTCERTRPDGTVLEVRSMPLTGGGLVRTYTDITSRKETEAVLRSARDQADDASRIKSEFLATMSHEIRSPMSGLVGVLDLLRETRLDPEQERMATMIHSSAQSLLAVLNDILDFSKIEAGALSVVPEPTALRVLVSDLAPPHQLQAARKQVGFRLSIDDTVPDHVEIDPLRLRQILTNLLSNAVKFTGVGRIELAMTVDGTGPAPRLRVTVSDTGIGMSAAVLDRLFEPFVQADGSTTRDFGGTGLGLCISRQLARLLDGTLEVASRPGEGSVFTLLLPLRPAAAPERAGSRAAASLSPPDWRGRRVLVTDDDPTNLWLSRRQLEMLGFAVDTAESGEQALALLGANAYDLLVTDCHMPGMDGVALTRAVRALPAPTLAALPVIGFTADVTTAQLERCRDAGMTDVAFKPVGRDVLTRLLACHLAGAEPTPDPRPAASTALATFDTAFYHELFAPGDDQGDGQAWLTEYLDAAERLAGELQLLLASRDTDAACRREIAMLAHRLVGSSLSVGASRLGAACQVLEQASAAEGWPALQRHHAALREALADARGAILAFTATLRQDQRA